MRTLITNISGSEQNLGWIPPHGVILDAGESHQVEGDLRTVLASGRNRFNRKEEIGGLNDAIDQGLVTVEEVAGPSSSSSSSSS